MATLVPAVIGGAIGFGYAKLSLDLPPDSSFPAVYGAAGSAVMILSVRIATIFRTMWNDRKKPSDDA